MKKLKTILFLSVISAFCAVNLSAQVPEKLKFCAGADNMPLSDNNPPSGFEVEFAKAIAKRIGAEAEFVWLSSHAESFEQAVLDGRCVAALGAIMEADPMAGSRALPGVVLTKPYYGAGYILIRRSDAPSINSLDDLGENRVAIEAESIVAYTLRQRGHKVHLLKDSEAVIKAVADGKERYGYLWGPIAGWNLRGRKDVVVETNFDSPDQWLFAMAVREKNAELLKKLNKAVRALSKSKTTARLMSAYDNSQKSRE